MPAVGAPHHDNGVLSALAVAGGEEGVGVRHSRHLCVCRAAIIPPCCHSRVPQHQGPIPPSCGHTDRVWKLPTGEPLTCHTTQTSLQAHECNGCWSGRPQATWAQPQGASLPPVGSTARYIGSCTAQEPQLPAIHDAADSRAAQRPQPAHLQAVRELGTHPVHPRVSSVAVSCAEPTGDHCHREALRLCKPGCAATVGTSAVWLPASLGGAA